MSNFQISIPRKKRNLHPPLFQSNSFFIFFIIYYFLLFYFCFLIVSFRFFSILFMFSLTSRFIPFQITIVSVNILPLRSLKDSSMFHSNNYLRKTISVPAQSTHHHHHHHHHSSGSSSSGGGVGVGIGGNGSGSSTPSASSNNNELTQKVRAST